MPKTVTIPLYMFDESHLADWITRCKSVMAESDSGAPELAPIIQVLTETLFERLGTEFVLVGDEIIARQVPQTAN